MKCDKCNGLGLISQTEVCSKCNGIGHDGTYVEPVSIVKKIKKVLKKK